MPNYHPNSTNYVHSFEPNTNDLVHAMAYDPYGAPVLRIDDTTKQHTSKNRVKTSGYQIIDYANFQYTKQSDVWDEQVVGGATSEWDQDSRMVKLTVNGTINDEVVRQTKRVVRYIPGRPNEVSMCVVFGTPTLGIRRRFGVFDDLVGFYFEDGGDGTYYCVIRNTQGGVTSEVRVARDDWSVDKFDGTGPSGIVADPEAIHMMDIEYEWYGAGQVEFNFIINNNKYPVHQFNHANISHTTYTYTPFIPVRVEIKNLTGVAGTHTMYQGSHSVHSESSASHIIGRVQNIASPVTGYTLSSSNTFYPVVSMRLKSTHLRGVVIPTAFTGATLDNTNVFLRIIRNGTLTGGSWTSYSTDSHVETNLTATDVTGGNILTTIFLPAGSQGSYYTFDDRAVEQFGRTTTTTLGDTSDVYTLAIAATNANKAGWGSINWMEVR